MRRAEFKLWLNTETSGRYVLTAPLLAMARQVVMSEWCDRARELGRSAPADLSGSCKFSSLFVKIAFGGIVQGNERHQYNRIRGVLVDLNEHAADVQAFSAEGEAHCHDAIFFGSREHLDSLISCLPRINRWMETWDQAIAHLERDPPSSPDLITHPLLF